MSSRTICGLAAVTHWRLKIVALKWSPGHPPHQYDVHSRICNCIQNNQISCLYLCLKCIWTQVATYNICIVLYLSVLWNTPLYKMHPRFYFYFYFYIFHKFTWSGFKVVVYGSKYDFVHVNTVCIGIKYKTTIFSIGGWPRYFAAALI